MELARIVEYLDELLEPERYARIDIALNGLQVEARGGVGSSDSKSQGYPIPGVGAVSDVQRVAFAVDCSSATIKAAAEAQCQLLVTHHGIFWGAKATPLCGLHGERVQQLLAAGMSLYASHLPLDGHQRLGNAAGLASALGLSGLRPAFSFNGSEAPVGTIAHCQPELERGELLERLRNIEFFTDYPALLFGSEKIERVAIATGSGSSLLEELPALGIDTLISGEPKHEAFHLARELRVNALFAGHYATERFGVLALKDVVQKDLGIETHWIEFPTGL